MSAAELLNRLEELGVTATAEGENLHLRPASAIPEELLDEVKAAKPEVLEELRNRCHICGRPDAAHELADDDAIFERPAAEDRCRRCRELEADGVAVLACSECDREVAS